MFISHDGEVCSSGFLPLPAGDVRHHSPADRHRDSPLVRSLRDPARLRGRRGEPLGVDASCIHPEDTC